MATNKLTFVPYDEESELKKPPKWQSETKEVMNKWTLQFSSKTLEGEFSKEHIDRNLLPQKILMICICVMVIFSLGGELIDFTGSWGPLPVPYSLTVVYLLTVTSLYIRKFRPYVEYIVSFAMCHMGMVLVWVNVLGPLPVESYRDYSCNLALLVVLALFFLVRVKIIKAAVITVIMILTQIVCISIKWDNVKTGYFPFVNTLSMLGTISLACYIGYRIERQTRIGFLQQRIMVIESKRAAATRARDEKILHNIFPETLTEKLKQKSNVSGDAVCAGDAYNSVSVLLCDIVGFTTMSSSITPQQLVQILNQIFSMIDTIMDNLHLEKIRTIGDAYLCVGNMSIPLENHEAVAVQAGFAMLQAITELRKKYNINLNLRVGVASGPIIAGVTGLNKWNYDIFGKTLTAASMMEHYGTPGHVCVSQSVYNALQGNKMFTCEAKLPFPKNADGEDTPTYIVTDTAMSITTLGEALEEMNLENIDAASPMTSQKRGSDLGLLSDQWSARIENDDEDVTKELLASKYYLTLAQDVFSTPKTSAKSRLAFADLKQQDTNPAEYLQRMRASLKFFKMGFSDSQFEREFRSANAKTTQGYAKHFAAIILVIFFFWMMEDIAANGRGVTAKRVPVLLMFVVIMIFFAGLWVLAMSKVYLKPIAEWISTAIFFVCGMLLILHAYIDNTLVYHYRRPLLFMYFSFLYTRIRERVIFVPVLVLTITACSVRYFTIVKEADGLTMFLWFPAIVVMGFLCGILLARSMRIGFVLKRMITNELMQQQNNKERTALLLRNILPEQILPRLRPGVTYLVDLFDNCTIMFVTLTNFQALSSLHVARQMSLLNEIFTAFDDLTFKCGLEKIKTINSTYMVASGIPVTRQDHCQASIILAVHMFKAFNAIKHKLADLQPVELRIGIASGPVVAGIIGKNKYSYDCWSDTVNTASRMESSGKEGFIQINKDSLDSKFKGEDNAESQRLFIPGYGWLPYSKRNDIEVKGKGLMNTYLLDPSQG